MNLLLNIFIFIATAKSEGPPRGSGMSKGMIKGMSESMSKGGSGSGSGGGVFTPSPRPLSASPSPSGSATGSSTALCDAAVKPISDYNDGVFFGQQGIFSALEVCRRAVRTKTRSEATSIIATLHRSAPRGSLSVPSSFL